MRKYRHIYAPPELESLLKIRYNHPKLKTNMARLRELVKELEELTYGKKKK